MDLHHCFKLAGDVTKGEMGFAAIPGAEEKFIDSINLAVKYAKALQCSRYVLCALLISIGDLGHLFPNCVPREHQDSMNNSHVFCRYVFLVVEFIMLFFFICELLKDTVSCVNFN